MPTGIPYADEVVNAKIGCTRIATGCLNCWSKELHDMRHRAYLAGKHVPEQYAKPFEETHLLLPERIYQVLSWRKPRRIFWCSTSDMFHKDVPFEFIDQMFAAMALTPQHTHLILTKRVKWMLEYYQSRNAMDESYRVDRMPQWYHVVTEWLDQGSKGILGRNWDRCEKAAEQTDYLKSLRNVWLGISCSTQKDLDEMAPVLFQIPAAHYWLSAEPLLEEIDAEPYLYPRECVLCDPSDCESNGDSECRFVGNEPKAKFNWVVVGCESGSHRRPCNIEHVRSIVRQCKAADVKVYVKQLDRGPAGCFAGGVITDPSDFPEGLRIQEIPK